MEANAGMVYLRSSVFFTIRKSIRCLRKSLERDRSPVAARGLRFDFGRSGSPAGGEGPADRDRPRSVLLSVSIRG